MENKENQSKDDDLLCINNLDCETNDEKIQNDLLKNNNLNTDKSKETTCPNTNKLFNQFNNPKPYPEIVNNKYGYYV